MHGYEALMNHDLNEDHILMTVMKLIIQKIWNL